jgi:malto-oligosyltrehalose trehalohydrolase
VTGRFSFTKRWGADPLDGGGARFRLWAPGVARIALVGGGADISMVATGDGWFEVATDEITPGRAYGFRLPDGMVVPDPAARAQAGDVHGLSRLVDPTTYVWQTPDWGGRPWEEAVIYELHVGTFTEDGTFDGVRERLDHLAATGITAIELMPIAQFGGDRGWGYDGVLHYAAHHVYGGPEGMKALIDAAHERSLMVALDVVYNHFGPDGNYLHLYAPQFFNAARHTPWGAAIDYERPAVRDFFVDNALFWLEEYRLDGLRLDAINEIQDPSCEHILETIARSVRTRITDRHVHLMTEDDRNIVRLHEREGGAVALYTAEWNDDFHHAAHVIATRETEGYYADYAVAPARMLARALAEGYAYQGEVSDFWGGIPRGVRSAHLPPMAFVNFLQNHDQIGNRAFSERLTDLAHAEVVQALMAVLLLSPQIPLLFMGEEWGEKRPFGFFTDFHGALADAVREGRRGEFRRFSRFADEANREKIPDPNAESTFLASRIDWNRMDDTEGRAFHDLVRQLLAIRRREIVPRLKGIEGNVGWADASEGTALRAFWRLAEGATLSLTANLGDEPVEVPPVQKGQLLFESVPALAAHASAAPMPAWSVLVLLGDDEVSREVK